MNTASKIIIIAALGATIVMALALKKGTVGTGSRTSRAISITNRVTGISSTGASPAIAARLPRLLDLGADKCVPCKKMAPILESLKTEYAGRLQVEFIDVWQNPDSGKEYGIEMIPTQIFFDANGKELFRHTGFYGREDILGKWKELGVDISGGKPSTGTGTGAARPNAVQLPMPQTLSVGR
jgi:thioredoxin 1